MSAFDFSGKTILVTGAGAGIGRAIVEKLIKCKAHVIALSLLQEELNVLAQELPGVKTLQADVSDWKQVREALEDLGPIDGLVNNAGTLILRSFLEITEDQIDKIYSVNLKGMINVSQVIVNNFLRNSVKNPAIVNISSIGAFTAVENNAVYNSSKAAVQSMTSNMALELGKKGIRVNSVNPTAVKTEMSRFVWESRELTQFFCSRTPMGRFAEQSEIADAVAFLLSDQASMVNGVALPVDGGYLTCN